MAWSDAVALLSATDPSGFAKIRDQAQQNPRGFVDTTEEERAQTPSPELLAGWRVGQFA